MSETDIKQFGSSDAQEADITEYRAISGLAVVGVIVGLLAPLALMHPLLGFLPATGIVVSALALKRILQASPALIGRKAALLRLGLSLLFGAMAGADWFTYRLLVDWEARKFAHHWYEFLRQGEPLKSAQLREHPGARLPLDERIADHYVAGSEDYRYVQDYLRRPEVRSLLALGPKADFRYYDTERQYRCGGADCIQQVYAVTTEEGGRKTSYFVRLILKRLSYPETGRAYWQLLSTQGGIRPEALGGEQDDREA
jgi:hypothetical protein